MMPQRSRRTARFCAAAAAALLLGAAGPARAAELISSDQAEALESELKQWLADTAGPQVTLPKRPVEVTASGDHYDIAIPFALLLGSSGTLAAGSGEMTAELKPLDQGKWSIESIEMPSPGHFAFDAGAKDKKMPVEVDFTIADQDTNAVFDENFATASTLHSTVGAVDLHVSSPMQDQTQHVDGTTAQAAMTPTTAGRVDLTENVSAKGLAVAGHTSDDHRVKLAAEHLNVAAHLDDVDRLKVLAALQAITRMSGEIAAAAQPPASGPKVPPHPGAAAADDPAAAIARAMVRNMVLTLRDVASGGEIDEVIDGLKVDVDGHPGGADHVTIGLGAAAPAGVLEAHIELALDGLVLAELPVSMAMYVPKHIKLRPFIGGVSMADVTRMALAATEPGAQMPDPSDLFSHGGISFGIESLLVDLGDTKLSGTARMLATGSDQVSGKAQVTATHFDALMQMVQQDPMLQGGFPVLLMLRGLGRASGDQTVWDVAVDHDDVTVNGTDLSAMMGGKSK